MVSAEPTASQPGAMASIAGLLLDGAGNLYGTTLAGGVHDEGVVFKLTPPVGGTAWAVKVLHSFNGTNGEGPEARLIADGAGNLFGTTQWGGLSDDGVAFELTP